MAAEQVAPSARSVEVLERLAPDAVARSVKLRLARLPAEAAALARAVAVLGDGADGRHAAALAGIERRSLAPAAAVLTRVDLLGRSRRCDSCIRSFETRSMRPARRTSAPNSTPRRRPSWLAAGAPVEQVGGQLLHAPPESVEEAVAPLRAAAREAAARAAPGSAARYLKQGAGGADERCRARRAAARAGRGRVEPGRPHRGREAARGGESARGPRAPRVGRARSRTGAVLGRAGGGGGASARAGAPGAAGRRRPGQAAASRADRELRQAARSLSGCLAAGRFDHGEAGGGARARASYFASKRTVRERADGTALAQSSSPRRRWRR